YLLGGLVPEPLGNAHPNIVPYQLFETADRPLILAAGNDRLFERTCGVSERRTVRDQRGPGAPSRRTDPDPVGGARAQTRGRVALGVRGRIGALRAGPNARRGLRLRRGGGRDPGDRRPRA